MTGMLRRASVVARAPLREVGLNTLAFGLVIAVQQLLVFPGLGRMTNAVQFSQVILLITVSTIVVNVIGTEASKVSLIRGEAYRRRDLPWDTPRIVLAGMLLVGLAVLLATALGLLPGALALQYGAITLLGIGRSYATAPDKHLGAFGRVVLVHGAYAIGAVGGLLLVRPMGSVYLPFLAAEAFAVVVVLAVRGRHREVGLTLRRTVEHGATLRTFGGLAAIALLINAVTYLDRLAITPMIGAGALAVYYSATALSSSLSLVTNPGGNAMLARLGRMPDARRGQMLRRGLLLVIPLVAVFWGVSLVVAYAGLVLLYPSHLEAARPLLVPVALAAAFSNAVALLSPLLQRFLPVRRLLASYLVYAAVHVAALIVLSTLWGLLGFAWASALAHAVLLGVYVLQIRRGARDVPVPPLAPVPHADPGADGTAPARDRAPTASRGEELP